jgi:hypothetical protein
MESRREARELRKEMEKNAVSGLGFSERQWHGQGEIKSGDHTVYYSKGEKAETGIVIVVQTNRVRSDVKKIVYNDRITALNIMAELVSILLVQVYHVHANTRA